jgi:predicted RNA-binding protein with PUA-like domain
MIRVRKDFGAEITSIDQADIPVRYWIKGTDNEFEARAALVIEADPVFDGRVASAYRLDRVGSETWEGLVTYSAQEWERNFEIGIEQVTITQALENVGNYAASGNVAPNFRGAIGVTRDSIEGVSIPIPTKTWSETHYFDPKLIDESYEDAAELLTGKTNDRPWRRHAAGEVMFEGVTGGISRGKTRMALTFKFRKSRNRGAFNIGNIPVPSKAGFDYLWVNYVEYPDPTSFRMVKTPYSVHVDRVIEKGSFDVLRLPS